jgi:hypothetical protein
VEICNKPPEMSREAPFAKVSLRGRKDGAALRLVILISAFIVMVLAPHASGEASEVTQPPTEAEIKAAFILNFAKFTDWPAQTFADENTPLTVGFVGADDAFAAFQAISSGKHVNGRKVTALHLGSAQNAPQCQILFLRWAKTDTPHTGLGIANDPGALSIGESEDFLKRGGMIRLFVEDNRIKFDVNVGAASRAKIRLSSKLLALARSVVDLPQPGGD